jgi:hypothetical protein
MFNLKKNDFKEYPQGSSHPQDPVDNNVSRNVKDFIDKVLLTAVRRLLTESLPSILSDRQYKYGGLITATE